VTPQFDLVVIGLGAFGAYTALEAARAGRSVLALDAGVPGDKRTLSYGGTRLFRQIYTEDPSLVTMTEEARPLWEALARSNPSLLRRGSGHLTLYPHREHPDFMRAVAVARQFGIAHEIQEDTRGRCGLWESQAFVLNVDMYFRTVLNELAELGVDTRLHTEVIALEETSSAVIVRTQQETFCARAVLLSAGPRGARLVSGLPPLRLERSPVLWYEVKDKRHHTFSVLREDGHFFAMPNGRTLKIFNFFPSRILDSYADHLPEVTAAETRLLERFAEEELGLRAGHIVERHACLYHSTEDSKFLIRRATSRIVLGMGDSGHAFKFAPLLGVQIFKLLASSLEAG